MREKWKVHRGWIKVHIAADIKTKETLGIEITDETVADSEKFDDLINQTEQNIEDKKELGGYKGFRDKYEYGKRWLSESVLSAVKRIFGETVRATSIVGMFREAKMKFTCYNILLNCI